MAVDVINGINGYVVDVSGTKTSYVPRVALLDKEVSVFEAGKSAIASLGGSQVINVGGTRLVTQTTGLANGTFKLKVGVDGGAVVEISVVIAGGFNLYSDLITAINAGLTNASLAASSAVVAGNIKVTSNSVGNISKIVLSAGATANLLAMTHFVSLLAPVNANLQTYLMGAAHPTYPDIKAWDLMVDMVDVFDTKGSNYLINGANVADAGATYSQSQVQVLVDMVNALKDKVSGLV